VTDEGEKAPVKGGIRERKDKLGLEGESQMEEDVRR